jgi:hypothetical protein
VLSLSGANFQVTRKCQREPFSDLLKLHSLVRAHLYIKVSGCPVEVSLPQGITHKNRMHGTLKRQEASNFPGVQKFWVEDPMERLLER